MNTVKNLIVIVAGLVVIVLVPLLYFHTGTNSSGQSNTIAQSASVLMEFNSQLRNSSTSYSNILAVIDFGAPLMAPKGGYRNEQINNYLAMWEMLGQFVVHGAVPQDMAYGMFYRDVEETYCNTEIKDFIVRNRTEHKNPLEHNGFVTLAQSFLKTDPSALCSPDFISQ